MLKRWFLIQQRKRWKGIYPKLTKVDAKWTWNSFKIKENRWISSNKIAQISPKTNSKLLKKDFKMKTVPRFTKYMQKYTNQEVKIAIKWAETHQNWLKTLKNSWESFKNSWESFKNSWESLNSIPGKYDKCTESYLI